MKLFSGIITILFALLISATAAWFSVSGLVALFAATAIPVMIMGTVLETSKLVAAGWLHANWDNRNVNFLHKTYLTIAVVALMLITSIGIYGFLSKGHLEQAAPLASVELQINAKQQQIDMLQNGNNMLMNELKQMDSGVDALVSTGKATQGLRARTNQTTERKNVQKQLAANNAQIQQLNAEMLPLKQQTVEVEAKLGPVKYVAQLFGWNDTDKAVRLVIGVIMLAFDPLAVILLISGTISLGEWAAERALRRKEKEEQQDVDVTNVDLRVYPASMAYAPPPENQNSNNVTVTEEPEINKEESEDYSNVVTVTEPDLALPLTADDEAKLIDEIKAELNEPVFTASHPVSDETLTSIRSSLEQEFHQTVEPVQHVEQTEEPTQTNEDKLAELRAMDERAPETVATPEIASETAPEAHQEPTVDVTTPAADTAPNDKQRLIEILEKRPEILQDLIDVISSHRQQEEAAIAKAKNANKPQPWIK